MTNLSTLTFKLTQASLTIATSFAVAFLFRGTTSLLAAMIIPILLFIFLHKFSLNDTLIVSFALILLTFIFITTQTVFMFIYACLGFALRLLIPKEKQNILFYRLLLYWILVNATLLIGIILTELLFAIPLHTFMLRISGGNALIYTLILSLEGLIVATFHTLLIRKLKRFY